LHEVLQFLARAIHAIGDEQAIASPQPVLKFGPVGGRGLTGEHLKGNRAQRKDIQMGAGAWSPPECFRGQEYAGGILDIGADMLRSRGPGLGVEGAPIA